MVKVNEEKLEFYANKLYRGDMARYKKKLEEEGNWFTLPSFLIQEERRMRITPSKSQQKIVIKNCKNKCVICGKPYKDRDDFDFHHINGDKGKTETPNLVLVCLSCHRKINTKAKSDLKDYKIKSQRLESKTIWDEYGVKYWDEYPSCWLEEEDMDGYCWNQSENR